MWKILLFILGLSFLVLMVMLRSLLLPLKAVVMNLLSIGAAYGVLVVVFQWGWLDGFLGFESSGALDTINVPLILAVVFGLSMDYEVFLLSRIRERYQAHGDNRRAVAEGLASSAPTISSAALIMTAVFAVFVFTGVPSIKELGLGNAVAIALDATLVRLVLVPATMQLMGKWNWWLPGWLDRLLPDLGFEHLDDAGRVGRRRPRGLSGGRTGVAPARPPADSDRRLGAVPARRPGHGGGSDSGAAHGLERPCGAAPVLRWAGAGLAAAGAGVLLSAFARFALEGLGTPAPVAPTERLVVGGLYRHVRNPMYLAVLAAIAGQAPGSAGLAFAYASWSRRSSWRSSAATRSRHSPRATARSTIATAPPSGRIPSRRASSRGPARPGRSCSEPTGTRRPARVAHARSGARTAATRRSAT